MAGSDSSDVGDGQPAAASPSGLTDELARRLALGEQVRAGYDMLAGDTDIRCA